MTRRFAIPCLCIVLSGLGAACTHPEHVHWSYEGESGPQHWGGISPEFALCGSGRSQSPIDVDYPAVPVANLVSVEYEETPLVIVNNGHTLQVNVSGENQAKLGGKWYKLLQFHFHGPSEHTVKGRHYDAHFVHKSWDGKLAVVGVLMKKGAANGPLQPVWDHLLA